MAIITPTSSSASSSQGSPRLDAPTKNEALTLKVLEALERGRPQTTDGDVDEWSLDGWDDPISPETTKKYQDIFASYTAKVAKAGATRTKYDIFA